MKTVAATAAIVLLVSAPHFVRLDGLSGQSVSAEQQSSWPTTEDARKDRKPPVDIADPDLAVRNMHRVWAFARRNDIVIVDCEALDDPTGRPDSSCMRTGAALGSRVEID